MVKIAILLSSYNGGEFICEQINSLLAQDCENRNLDIFIRDDGSTDRTTEIVSKYANEYDNIYLIRGENVGVTHSFFKLLELPEVKGYDYYAFCDQDDVWLDTKLTSMIAEMNNSKPCLVCCSYRITDDNLNKIRDVSCNKDVALGRILVDSNYPGCTMMFNQKLFCLIANSLNSPMAWKSSIHDLWVLMIATVFGEVKVSGNIGILYRQHSNNAIGASTSFLSRLQRSIKSTLIMRDKHSYIDNAIIFEQVFRDNNIPSDAVRVLEDAFNSGGCLRSRLKMIFGGNIYKQGVCKNLYFRLRVLFHLYRPHYGQRELS